MAIVRPPSAGGSAPSGNRMAEQLERAKQQQVAANGGVGLPTPPGPGASRIPPVTPMPATSPIPPMPTPTPTPITPPNPSPVNPAPGNKMTQGDAYSPTDTSTIGSGQKTEVIEDPEKSGKKNKILIFAAIGLVVIILSVLLLKVKMGSGEKIGEPTATPTPTPEPDYIVEEVNKYNSSEIQALRAAGYTGDEIESAAAMYIPASDLIAQAEIDRQAWLEEAIKPMLDTASPEYKENLKQTWLGLEKVEDINGYQNSSGMYEVRRNLDYEKIDVYGHQLYIKIYLDSSGENYFFHQTTPTEYLRLEQEGNIIVTYTYMHPMVSSTYGYSEDTSEFIIIKSSVEIID